MMEEYDFIFLMEKSLGLFWVLIQQGCFCGVKYVYEGLIPKGQSLRRIVAAQAAFFAVLVVLCFERELGLAFLSSALRFGDRDFYPWAMRIALCSAMILFDALLLLCAFRIYRLYRRGLAAARPTLPADAALFLLTGALCVAYTAGIIHATLANDLPMDDFYWMGRAFIQLSNFFYVPLEITGALLLYRFWRAVQENVSRDRDSRCKR